MATIKNILDKYYKKLDCLDLELIISRAINKTREFVLAYPEYKLNKYQVLRIKHDVSRRVKGEPLAYILGKKEFYGLDFKVDKNVLIPRPETEILIEEALNCIQESKIKNQELRIIDIGTGSGNIIISLADKLNSHKLQTTNYKLYGIDISPKALKIAKFNAKKHGIDKKIKFLHGNLLEPFLNSKNYKLKTKNYLIIANLPYLDTGWKNLLNSSETRGLKFEPQIALYAGKDGLNAYQKLAQQLKLLITNCKLQITIFCEIGHHQKREMQKIFSFAKKVEFKKDISGKWRICKIVM